MVSERSVVRVESDAAWEVLAPLGCAVQTGADTVFNVLRPYPGSSLVVYGAGSVGLAAVLAAQLTAASRMVVVDRVPERLELARSVGATHVVDARNDDVLEAVPRRHPWRCRLRDRGDGQHVSAPPGGGRAGGQRAVWGRRCPAVRERGRP